MRSGLCGAEFGALSTGALCKPDGCGVMGVSGETESSGGRKPGGRSPAGPGGMTAAQRTRLFLRCLRAAYLAKPGGYRDGRYLLLLLAYALRTATALYVRVLLIWPTRWLYVRTVATWNRQLVITYVRMRERLYVFVLPRYRRPDGTARGAEFARAVVRGDLHNTAVLLARGADVCLPTATGSPVLVAAIRHRRWEIARMLIDAGADPDARYPASLEPAVVLAARAGDAETVRSLLEHGCDPNATGLTGFTAHGEAMRTGQTAIAAMLEARGADVRRLSPSPRLFVRR